MIEGSPENSLSAAAIPVKAHCLGPALARAG